MIKGRMYCLNNVLEIKNVKASHYLLIDEEDKQNCEISFGRQRKLKVSSESYVVALTTDGKYNLDKINFNDEGKCDYLTVLKERKIAYEIPKKLPESTNPGLLSRFECAIDRDLNIICGFFGKNGYATTKLSYVGFDKWEAFEICLNEDSFHIGNFSISKISGDTIPNNHFIERLLEEDVRVEEGEPVVALFMEAGVSREFLEFINLETSE